MYTFNNGDIYQGQWNIATNKPEGQGVMIRASDNELYEGHFINGLKHGYGRSIYEVGSIYVGQWKEGKEDGIGTEFWSKKSANAKTMYDGEWKEEKKHGYGVYTTNNGDRYEGEWKDDQMDGKGILI